MLCTYSLTLTISMHVAKRYNFWEATTSGAKISGQFLIQMSTSLLVNDSGGSGRKTILMKKGIQVLSLWSEVTVSTFSIRLTYSTILCFTPSVNFSIESVSIWGRGDASTASAPASASTGFGGATATCSLMAIPCAFESATDSATTAGSEVEGIEIEPTTSPRLQQFQIKHN